MNASQSLLPSRLFPPLTYTPKDGAAEIQRVISENAWHRVVERAQLDLDPGDATFQLGQHSYILNLSEPQFPY